MRNTVAIQSRREYTPEGGKLGVYFAGVIMGVDGQMEFSTYDPKIQPYIVIGKNIDIEWEESPGKLYQGNPTTKRKVTQLYVDGKPIVEAKAFAGNPFGGGYKDSPETRASIEAQTAANDVVSLLVAKVITLDHSLAQKAIAWLDSKLPSGVISKPESKPASSAKQQFLNACKEAGYSITTKQGLDSIKAWLGKAGKTDLPFDELTTEKQKELIAIMQAEKLP